MDKYIGDSIYDGASLALPTGWPDPGHIENRNGNRKYLPTLSDLVDRLTIVQQKMIFIPERAKEYKDERELLIHDIDLLLKEYGQPLTGKAIWAITLLQLSNRWVWENETRIRDGSSDEPAAMQLSRLKATHAVNGIRNTAKNILSEEFGGRHDYKIDALCADLPAEFGYWNVF